MSLVGLLSCHVILPSSLISVCHWPQWKPECLIIWCCLEPSASILQVLTYFLSAHLSFSYWSEQISIKNRCMFSHSLKWTFISTKNCILHNFLTSAQSHFYLPTMFTSAFVAFLIVVTAVLFRQFFDLKPPTGCFSNMNDEEEGENSCNVSICLRNGSECGEDPV